MAVHNKVVYTFKELDLSVEIDVDTPAQEYEAANNEKYEGYAITKGTVTYTDSGTPRTVNIAPQTLNPYNVLWQRPGAGSGRSQDGIDTNGITIEGDNGNLAWGGDPNQFWLQEGTVSQPVTLDTVTNWPPAS